MHKREKSALPPRGGAQHVRNRHNAAFADVENLETSNRGELIEWVPTQVRGKATGTARPRWWDEHSAWPRPAAATLPRPPRQTSAASTT
jgi:hypothetical protein